MKELPHITELKKADGDLRDAPQPFTRGMVGHVCIFCYGEYGAADALEAEDAWVCCPWCEAWHHYGCIKIAKLCTCGNAVRVQRKPKNWV